MRQLTFRITSLLCVALLVLSSGFTVAAAKEKAANELLLNGDPANHELRMTTTVVAKDRFTPGTPTFTTGITDIKFAVQKIRTDLELRDTIPPALRMERNGVEWNEQNMLISGLGFSSNATYPYGKQQGQGRHLNVRVMYPRKGWNGKLFFWHHGSADTQLLTFTPIIEPELLLKEGWAVAMAQFNGPAPEQQNPNAVDDSYWKSVDEMYRADPVNYWSYTAHPGWWQFTSAYYYLNDGYHLQIFRNTVYWVERGIQPPKSRIDPLLVAPGLDLNTVLYPNLPTNDFTQDSLNRAPSLLTASAKDDLNWQRNNPDQAVGFATDKGMVTMPHLAARWGIFYVGYKYQQILPFTHEQLVNGYTHGNISFAGYANYNVYLHAFRQALAELVVERLYDPWVAAKFINGDPAAPKPPF